MADLNEKDQTFWDRHARRDPLWAILSDPAKTGRRWDLQSFLETGRREVSLLMYQLQALDVAVDRRAALDFGCGVGRLSLPLAAHFDRVVGLDISPEMVRLAREINSVPDRVQYRHNPGPDLPGLATGEFTFMYSNVVLQHIEPVAALRYLRELFRVVARGGVLVFQLPSHRRPPGEQQPASTPMAAEAYRASIRVEGDFTNCAAPGAEAVLAASITNTSGRAWSQLKSGPIRLGNHWLAGLGHAMLIQDDGRALLPADLAAGETCHLTLRITLPREPGEYQLECDLVHEGISWFADKGSKTWKRGVRVGGVSDVERAAGAATPMTGAGALSLPDEASVEDPEPLPMHGIHRQVVEQFIRDHGGILFHDEIDERCGREWVGYRYIVRKM